MSVKEYTEEFYRLGIRTRHVEDDLENLRNERREGGRETRRENFKDASLS